MNQLKFGQEVSFGAQHISNTEYEDPASSDWEFYFNTKVIVSKDVLAKKEFNVIWRVDQLAADDSGWNLITGYEDHDVLKDSFNYEVIPIGEILNIDDSILGFIDDLSLCAYIRTNNGKFTKIDNEKIEFF